MSISLLGHKQREKGFFSFIKELSKLNKVLLISCLLGINSCSNSEDSKNSSGKHQNIATEHDNNEEKTHINKKIAKYFYAFQFTDNEADNFNSKGYKIDHAGYDKEGEILGYEKGDTIDITKKEILTDCNHDGIIDKKFDTREIITPQEKKKISKIITRRAIIDEIH